MDLLAQMATFVRIVDGKSLSSAARAQRLSLPAVSRQLRALEADLGTTLIARSTRKLHVTDSGREWYGHCVRLLHDLEQARDAVRGTRVIHGTLVVSASVTFGTVVLRPCVRRLAIEHPQLSVDLRLEDRLVDLIGEGVDVAIRAGSPPPDTHGVVAQPMFTMRRVLVAAPKWLRKHGAPRNPEQLAGRDCLVQVTPAGTTIRWMLRRREKEIRTVEVRGSIRTNTPLALRDFALDELGIAYLPDWLVAEDLSEGRLRRVLPEWMSDPITAWAIHRAELRGFPRLLAFLDVLPRDSASRRGSAVFKE
jgi:DNA-binding transcriptional LysR family regulator